MSASRSPRARTHSQTTGRGRRRRLALLGVPLLACTLVTGCGDDEGSVSTAPKKDKSAVTTTTGDAGAADASTTTTAPVKDGSTAGSTAGSTGAKETEGGDPKDMTGKPKVSIPAGDPPTTLKTEDLVVGTGPEAVAGSQVQVQYVGVSWSDGTEFDASWDRGGEPFTLTLGSGQVIPGWDQGLIGMKVGGRRQLVIPPDLAYGDSGQGDIKPGETLVFVVDLVNALTKPVVDVSKVTPGPDVVSTDLTVGTGAELTTGKQAQIQYVGVLLSTGKEFGSSWTEGTPLELTLAPDKVIPGLAKGLAGMKVGGRRQLVIPPALAYGDKGNGPIGPNETLVFVVDLLAVAG